MASDCELLSKTQLATVYGGQLQHHRAVLYGKEDQGAIFARSDPTVSGLFRQLS